MVSTIIITESKLSIIFPPAILKGLYYDASHEADRRVKVRREPYAIHEEASEFDQGFQVVDNLSEEKLLQQQIEMLRSRKVSQVMRESETSSKRRAEPQFQPPQPPALNDQVRERVAPAYDSIPHTQTLEQDRLQNPSSNFKAMKTSKEATTQQRVSKQGRVRSNDRDAIPRRKGTDKVHDSNPPVDRSVPINRSSSGASKEVDMAAEEAAVAAAKVFATSLSSSGARRQPNPQKGRDAKSHVADTWSQVQQPLNMQRNESEIAVSEDKSAELDLSATFLSSSSSSLSVDGYDRYFSDAIQSVHRITILDKSKAESRSSRRSISDSYPELSLLNSDPHERLPVEKIDTGTSQSEATSAFHGARDNYGVNVSSNDAGRRHSGRAATGRDSTAKAVAAAHAFSISLDEHARKEQTGDGVRLAPLDKGQSHNGTASQLLSPVSLNKHIHDSKRQVLRGSDEDLDLRGVVQSSSSSSSSSITSISNLSVDGYDKYLEDAIQSVPHSYSVDMFTTDTLHREVNSFDKRIIDNTNQRKVSIDKRQGHTDHPGGDSIVLTVTGRRHISGGSMGQVPSAEAVAAAHAFSVSIGHGEGPRNQKEKDGRLRSPENRPLQHESTGTLSQLKETRNRSVARDDNNLDLSVLSQTHRSSDFIVERHSGNFQDVIQNARHRSAVNTSDIGRNNRGAKDSFQDPNLPHHSLDMSSIEREKTGKKNPPRAAIDTWRDSPVKADSRGVSFAAISDPNTQGNTREAAAAAHAYSMSAGEGARRARRPQNDELVIADEDAGRQFRASKQDLVLDGAGKKTASLDPDTVAVSEDDSLELDLSTSLHDTSSRSSSSTFSIDSYDRYLQDAVQIIEKRASSVAAVSVSSDNNSRSRDAVKDAYHMSQSGDSMPKAASIKSSEDGQISTGKGSGTATPGLHTSSTPAELFSNKSVTDNLNVSLRGKYGNEKEEVNSVHDSSLLQHDYRTSLNRSNSETKSPRIGLEPNHSLDSLISSTTSGSVNSTSVATDKLLQQWEDLFATRISPKQNPVQEESKSFMIDSPTATVDRSNFPLISTRNSISSSEKDGELVVDNDTNVSRSSVSYHNSESENKALDGVESASKSQSRDTLFSSKDSDSTAELLRQWNELYSTSRVADRRDVVLTDELRMLSLESTVFSILKELQPPNPPSMPMRTSDDSFRHSLHPDSIKPVLSSSWNSSVAEILGSDFLLEHSDNGLQSLEKIRNDQSSGDLTKQTSLQYSEDSSRNVVSQVGVRDSSGSVSSSTAAEHSLYDRWNTLYKARMSGSIVNSAPIVPVATSNKSDISYNDSDMSSIIDRAGDNSHENLGRKNGDDGLIAIQNVGKESMLSFPRSQARDVTNSIQKDFDISDILSLEKNEGGSFAVAHSLSNIESSMYSFTGRASILDSSEALAAEDRHSSDQSNVSDDVSITDLLKRWQDRRAGSEILTEDPARHFGVNNIIARGEEGTFSTIRADMTRPLLPRFDDSVLSSTVDNEDDHHLEDLSLSDTLKLSSFSKSKGPRTLKSYDNPSPVDSKMSTSSLKDDFTGRELAYRIAGTSDNVSLRTFRSNKLEISNSFSYSRGVGNISAGSDSDAGSLSGRAMSLLDVSLVNTTATEQSILHKDTQAEDTSLYRGSVSNDVLRGGDYSPASTSIPHSSSYPSLSEALTRLPLRMQDLQDRINASQNSQLVASDLSSDFSDGPTPDFEIDLGESSDSLSTPLITKAGANIVMDTSLPSSSASSIDVGIRWEAVGTNHTKEGSARSSLNLSSRNDFSKSFDDESAEIQHALSDMRGKLLSSLAATATPIQRNSTSIDRSVNTLTEMEGWSVSNLMEQDASKVVREDIAESKGVDHTTSVQFRLYQPIPPTNLGSTNLADGAEATDSFEKIDYDLLLGLRGSEAKEPDSDSDNDVDILFRSTHPSAVAPSSLASEANASSGDAIQTFQPVSYMNGFLSGPSMNPSPNLSVRPVPNEFQSSDSESESRNRSRGTTSMSMSGSISNLSNYTLRGSPSLSAQPPSLRQNYAYTPPSSDILADFSVSSDLRVAETEAVPIDSIHSEEPVDYLARSVRM